MKKELSYLDSVHRDGRIWNLSVMVILLLFPVAVGLIFHAGLDWRGFAFGMLATAPMYWAVGVIETFTFVPMLGAGGSYLAFVTGNITNLKAPAALNALELFEADVKTAEGEVVSTIAIATLHNQLEDFKSKVYRDVYESSAYSFYYLSIRKGSDNVSRSIGEAFAMLCQKEGNVDFRREGCTIYKTVMNEVEELVKKANFAV